MNAPLSREWCERLVARLRGDLGRSVALDVEPRRVAAGGDAVVYRVELSGAASGPRGVFALRVFTRGQSAEREAALQNAVAEQGFPAPRVVWAADDPAVVGGAAMLIEWVPGRPLFGSTLPSGATALERLRFAAGELRGVARFTSVVVEIAAAIHGLDADEVAAACDAVGHPRAMLGFAAQLDRLRERLEPERAASLDAAVRWLEDNRPPTPDRLSLIHGDLNPTNFIFDRGRLQGVIDWSAASLGDPAHEIALLRVGLSTLPIRTTRPISWGVSRITRRMAERITREYQEARTLDPDALRYYEAWTCMILIARSCEWRRGERDEHGPWDTPAGQRSLAQGFEDVAGFGPLSEAPGARS